MPLPDAYMVSGRVKSLRHLFLNPYLSIYNCIVDNDTLSDILGS